jgi:hypothetical protein
MKSLAIKTAAVTIAVVLSGIAFSAFKAHQTKVKNDKTVAEVTEMTNKLLAEGDELYRRIELGLVKPAEAAARCDAGNDNACEMSVKYMIVRVHGDSLDSFPDTPNPIREARPKCAADRNSDACIELELLQPVLEEHNQKILGSYN